MITSTPEEAISSLLINKTIDIAASTENVFATLLEQLGPASEMPDGTSFPMKLEPWPGGRWYRDLGNNAGHLWAHVQVIKPPALLELYGPMFMSYPAISHIQYRITAEGAGSRLRLVHRCMGQITQEHRKGVNEGWDYELKKIRDAAERRKGTK